MGGKPLDICRTCLSDVLVRDCAPYVQLVAVCRYVADRQFMPSTCGGLRRHPSGVTTAVRCQVVCGGRYLELHPRSCCTARTPHAASYLQAAHRWTATASLPGHRRACGRRATAYRARGQCACIASTVRLECAWPIGVRGPTPCGSAGSCGACSLRPHMRSRRVG